jgi:hypothetical protein
MSGHQRDDAPPSGAVLGLTATRVMAGAISLSISSHFPVSDGSKLVNPVVLPPGRAMLATKPLPKGSDTPTNTIGTVCVSRANDGTIGGWLVAAGELGIGKLRPHHRASAAPNCSTA